MIFYFIIRHFSIRHEIKFSHLDFKRSFEPTCKETSKWANNRGKYWHEEGVDQEGIHGYGLLHVQLKKKRFKYGHGLLHVQLKKSPQIHSNISVTRAPSSKTQSGCAAIIIVKPSIVSLVLLLTILLMALKVSDGNSSSCTAKLYEGSQV